MYKNKAMQPNKTIKDTPSVQQMIYLCIDTANNHMYKYASIDNTSYCY